MTDPRDYQPFLRASADEKSSMRSMVHLLPVPPPAATLWSQGGFLVANALLPLALWLFGRLDPIDVILLYLVEGAAYSAAVIARILFTASAASDPDERPRVLTALGYAIWHSVVWAGLAIGVLACVAPKPGTLPIAQWLFAMATRLEERSMVLPALATAVFIGLDAVRRSDFIDAYLELGPRETARYGYGYPVALIFLLGSALLLRFTVMGGDLDALDRGVPLIAPTFLAFWLVGWRVLMQLLNLTLPRWGRGLARFEGRFEQAMHPPTQRRNSARS
ncbi:MAG: hypothetical protein ABIO49_09275 [Dokdonella sp.]